MKKFFENLNYIVLMLLIIGQCTIGANWVVGQFVYLTANLISVLRCWILKRPMADKIKDCACLAITLGLLGIRFLGGLPFQVAHRWRPAAGNMHKRSIVILCILYIDFYGEI